MATRSSFSNFLKLEFVLGALLVGVIGLAVIFSGVIFPGGAEKIDLMSRLVPPFARPAHIFGTDPLGRDVLTRVMAGGKISLLVGFVSVAGGVTVGVVMGLIAGYYRGIWDMLVMRFADIQARASLHPARHHLHRHRWRRPYQHDRPFGGLAMGTIRAPGARFGPDAA